MESIRAFIAIELPEGTRSLLDQSARELGGLVPHKAVRWVKPENIHLTLRFLGDTGMEKLPALTSSMNRVAARHGPFVLELDKLGCFPNPRRPRVIWVGLAGDLYVLENLHKAIAETLVPLGWMPEERGFHPHLTLGRVKDSRLLAKSELPWGQKMAAAKITVNDVHLIESRLEPGGAVYSIHHSSRLKGSVSQTSADDGPL